MDSEALTFRFSPEIEAAICHYLISAADRASEQAQAIGTLIPVLSEVAERAIGSIPVPPKSP